MDLDDVDEPSQIPSRVSRFAPKNSKLKPQSQPNPKSDPEHHQQSFSKAEPEEPVSAPKPELQNAPISKQSKDDDEIKPNMNAAEPSNGAVKIKTEANAEAKEDDPMDIDKEEEEEDMIVREIDVFFSPSIDADTQLYVMQYPLRPCWRPYELDERCEEVRVKPATSEVEIDLSIDNDSKNWDSDYANRLNMTKQTLSSSWTPPSATGYAVGVLIGNKLHLNPIHAVVQLRPSMEHLKSGASKKKNNIAVDAEVNVKVEDSNEGKHVGPSKKQIKQIELGNEEKSDVEECWIPLKYQGSKSDFSSTYLQKMLAHESSSIEFTMSPYEYMSSLCPGASNNNIKPKGPSRRVLLSLPLEERIKKLLLEGPPIHRFAGIRHFAPDYNHDEDVLEVLKKYGQLVQGFWVPKTYLLFPNSNDAPKLAARDYVLCLFSKSLVISSAQLNVPLKKEDLKSFLNIFAVERLSFKDWKFKEHMDASFLKCYPDIVKSQEEAWDGIEKKLVNRFNLAGKSRPGMKNAMTRPSVVNNPVKLLNPDKNAARSARVVTKRTITDETREALRKAMPKVFQNRKVCSFQMICEGLRELAISYSTLPKADPRILVAAASGADAPPEELQEVISEVATKIHGFYVLKSSTDHPEYDPLRKVVIDLLLAKGPNAKIKKTEVLEAARLTLKRDVTNNEYNKVMTDICESKGSAWVLKSGDGKPS